MHTDGCQCAISSKQGLALQTGHLPESVTQHHSHQGSKEIQPRPQRWEEMKQLSNYSLTPDKAGSYLCV